MAMREACLKRLLHRMLSRVIRRYVRRRPLRHCLSVPGNGERRNGICKELPFFSRQQYFQKPPVKSWIVFIQYRIDGVSTIGAAQDGNNVAHVGLVHGKFKAAKCIRRR